jgi:hypothetical protein
LPTSGVHNEYVYQVVTPPSLQSTITIIPNTTKDVRMESNRTSAPSVLHLTTAIDDNDDELFSSSRRKIPTALVKIFN